MITVCVCVSACLRVCRSSSMLFLNQLGTSFFLYLGHLCISARIVCDFLPFLIFPSAPPSFLCDSCLLTLDRGATSALLYTPSLPSRSSFERSGTSLMLTSLCGRIKKKRGNASLDTFSCSSLPFCFLLLPHQLLSHFILLQQLLFSLASVVQTLCCASHQGCIDGVV